jgi:hypothetical protein
MKKFLFVFVMAMSLCVNVSAQYSKNHYSHNGEFTIGKGLTFAGGMFTLAGFLTPPDWTYKNGVKQIKPFSEQGARSMCIVSGFTLTCTGLITMLAERSRR